MDYFSHGMVNNEVLVISLGTNLIDISDILTSKSKYK